MNSSPTFAAKLSDKDLLHRLNSVQKNLTNLKKKRNDLSNSPKVPLFSSLKRTRSILKSPAKTFSPRAAMSTKLTNRTSDLISAATALMEARRHSFDGETIHSGSDSDNKQNSIDTEDSFDDTPLEAFTPMKPATIKSSLQRAPLVTPRIDFQPSFKVGALRMGDLASPIERPQSVRKDMRMGERLVSNRFDSKKYPTNLVAEVNIDTVQNEQEQQKQQQRQDQQHQEQNNENSNDGYDDEHFMNPQPLSSPPPRTPKEVRFHDSFNGDVRVGSNRSNRNTINTHPPKQMNMNMNMNNDTNSSSSEKEGTHEIIMKKLLETLGDKHMAGASIVTAVASAIANAVAEVELVRRRCEQLENEKALLLDELEKLRSALKFLADPLASSSLYTTVAEAPLDPSKVTLQSVLQRSFVSPIKQYQQQQQPERSQQQQEQQQQQQQKEEEQQQQQQKEEEEEEQTQKPQNQHNSHDMKNTNGNETTNSDVLNLNFPEIQAGIRSIVDSMNDDDDDNNNDDGHKNDHMEPSMAASTVNTSVTMTASKSIPSDDDSTTTTVPMNNPTSTTITYVPTYDNSTSTTVIAPVHMNVRAPSSITTPKPTTISDAIDNNNNNNNNKNDVNDNDNANNEEVVEDEEITVDDDIVIDTYVVVENEKIPDELNNQDQESKDGNNNSNSNCNDDDDEEEENKNAKEEKDNEDNMDQQQYDYLSTSVVAEIKVEEENPSNIVTKKDCCDNENDDNDVSIRSITKQVVQGELTVTSKDISQEKPTESKEQHHSVLQEETSTTQQQPETQQSKQEEELSKQHLEQLKEQPLHQDSEPKQQHEEVETPQKQSIQSLEGHQSNEEQSEKQNQQELAVKLPQKEALCNQEEEAVTSLNDNNDDDNNVESKEDNEMNSEEENYVGNNELSGDNQCLTMNELNVQNRSLDDNDDDLKDENENDTEQQDNDANNNNNTNGQELDEDNLPTKDKNDDDNDDDADNDDYSNEIADAQERKKQLQELTKAINSLMHSRALTTETDVQNHDNGRITISDSKFIDDEKRNKNNNLKNPESLPTFNHSSPTVTSKNNTMSDSPLSPPPTPFVPKVRSVNKKLRTGRGLSIVTNSDNGGDDDDNVDIGNIGDVGDDIDNTNTDTAENLSGSPIKDPQIENIPNTSQTTKNIGSNPTIVFENPVRHEETREQMMDEEEIGRNKEYSGNVEDTSNVPGTNPRRASVQSQLVDDLNSKSESSVHSGNSHSTSMSVATIKKRTLNKNNKSTLPTSTSRISRNMSKSANNGVNRLQHLQKRKFNGRRSQLSIRTSSTGISSMMNARNVPSVKIVDDDINNNNVKLTPAMLHVSPEDMPTPLSNRSRAKKMNEFPSPIGNNPPFQNQQQHQRTSILQKDFNNSNNNSNKTKSVQFKGRKRDTKDQKSVTTTLQQQQQQQQQLKANSSNKNKRMSNPSRKAVSLPSRKAPSIPPPASHFTSRSKLAKPRPKMATSLRSNVNKSNTQHHHPQPPSRRGPVLRPHKREADKVTKALFRRKGLNMSSGIPKVQVVSHLDSQVNSPIKQQQQQQHSQPPQGTPPPVASPSSQRGFGSVASSFDENQFDEHDGNNDGMFPPRTTPRPTFKLKPSSSSPLQQPHNILSSSSSAINSNNISNINLTTRTTPHSPSHFNIQVSPDLSSKIAKFAKAMDAKQKQQWLDQFQAELLNTYHIH